MLAAYNGLGASNVASARNSCLIRATNDLRKSLERMPRSFEKLSNNIETVSTLALAWRKTADGLVKSISNWLQTGTKIVAAKSTHGKRRC